MNWAGCSKVGNECVNKLSCTGSPHFNNDACAAPVLYVSDTLYYAHGHKGVIHWIV